MAGNEQVKPLAPAAFRLRSDDDEAISGQLKLHQRKYIKCCGCITALLLILVVTMLVLSFTIFHVKDPKIKMNEVTIVKGSLNTNVTLLADVSVKNPNVATFKFSNTTTTVSYGGMAVGEGRGPPGQAKARRTIRMNITVDIITGNLLAVPSFASDMGSEALNMSSYTRIGGRVKILKIIKKNVVVTMNCTFTYNVSSQAIQEDRCMTHVRI